MCMHPFAKEALTLHLARSEGNEHYFGCNLMYYKILASSYQHLMAEAPTIRHPVRPIVGTAETGEIFRAVGAVLQDQVALEMC